jgi:hypothetical protein
MCRPMLRRLLRSINCRIELGFLCLFSGLGIFRLVRGLGITLVIMNLALALIAARLLRWDGTVPLTGCLNTLKCVQHRSI